MRQRLVKTTEWLVLINSSWTTTLSAEFCIIKKPPNTSFVTVAILLVTWWFVMHLRRCEWRKGKLFFWLYLFTLTRSWSWRSYLDSFLWIKCSKQDGVVQYLERKPHQPLLVFMQVLHFGLWIWWRWFLRRRENWRTQRKPLEQGENPQHIRNPHMAPGQNQTWAGNLTSSLSLQTQIQLHFFLICIMSHSVNYSLWLNG